jgi:hypothetical protein
MSLTVSTLTDEPGTFLVCLDHPEQHWSATPGDYFWMAHDDVFRCHCGNPLVEARTVTDLVVVAE